MFAQMIVNGLLLGGFYACIGVAFSLVYGIMGVINLAQGTQIILGAYVQMTGVLPPEFIERQLGLRGESLRLPVYSGDSVWYILVG